MKMTRPGAARIIHQIWMQGLDVSPAYVRSNSRTIQDMHPEWSYMFWNAARIERLADENAEWREKYASFTLLHQRVDFAKLIILYAFGGIVIDADAYTIRPLDALFDEFADADLVVSNIRRVPLPFGWVQNFLICGIAGSCMNNGSYIGKAGSHVIRHIISGLTQIPNCASGSDFQRIQQTTGPKVFNALLHEYIRGAPHGNVVVLDSEILEPCIGTSCEITDRTYVVHTHKWTWCGALITVPMRAYVACPHLFHALFFVALIAVIARLMRALVT